MNEDENQLINEGLDAHGKYTDAYVGILNTYKSQIEESIKKKNELKDKFFKVIRFVMIVLICLFASSIIAAFFIFWKMVSQQYQSVAVITGAITAIVSSFVTMLLSIFKLPQIIADYLFNKEEDQLMNEIIKNIQAYEIDAVKHERIAKLEAEKEKNNRQKNDEPIKNSPNVSGRQPENMNEQCNITE